MNIYRIDHDNGEKTHICAYSAIEAMKIYMHGYALPIAEDIDDHIDDIVFIPNILWMELKVSGIDGEDGTEIITFWDYMQTNPEPHIFATTID